MEAFEFEAIHENGIIKIPDELKKNLTKKIKIIILTKEEKQDALSNLLLEAPTWDESDITDFQRTIREGYKNWKIEEF
jgi:flavodoxin